MPALSKKSALALNHVKQVRVFNNDLWMEILKIALEAEPKKTRKIMRKIHNCDRAVSGFMNEIIDD